MINPERINKMENMSILKFMIDNQYFENSDIELENLTIIKNNVEYPHLAFSFKDNSLDEEILDNNNINNYNNTINSNQNNKNNKQYQNFQKDESINNENNNRNTKNVQEQSKKALNDVKKEHRKKANLPIEEEEFLKYFEKCIENLREIFYIQQKCFFLFKMPYLYNLINEEKNPLTEDTKKRNWKEKLNLKNYLLQTKIKYSLIISGECIQYCIEDGEPANLFWFLIQHSRSIICCRCSPKQKCDIVEFVKKHTKEITLAIGDGENDVNMIKAANVGIGIFGKEGSQAAFNSDYAFYEFKYLRILLFINGRFALLRNTYFLNMYFFKNLFYTFQPIIFTFYSLYSGLFFYDEFYDSMFNTFISIFPLIAFSIIDEDFNPDSIKKEFNRKITFLLPDMFKQTRDSKPFNLIKYITCNIVALILAIILFTIYFNSFIDIIKNEKGDVSSYYEFIFCTYLSVLLIHFFMVYLDSSLFNYIIIIIFIIQIFLDIIFILVMNRIPSDNKLSGVTSNLLSITHFFTIVASCAIVCLPFYILRRMEYFFGLNIANFIKNNNIEIFFKGKFYIKKIRQMIRAISAIIKFKRINEELIIVDKKNINQKPIYESLIDNKMAKLVENYKNNKKKK